MIKQIWSSFMALRRWSSASRRQRSASTLSWSGGDGGDPATDAIFVAQPQSQREERVAWGGQQVVATEADWRERECGVEARVRLSVD
nr:hypothetical protein CFP56_79194 [Quercus suber]